MKVEKIRDLERVVTEHPGDDLAVQALELARVRRGLGWHGEELPPRVFPAEERGVYRARSTYQVVYVPGGEVACSEDVTTCDKHREAGGDHTRTLEPFYLGRFPVTWQEWVVYRAAGSLDGIADSLPEYLPGTSNDLAHHPIVNVSHTDARGFCERSGMRLPGESEWRRAALGASILHPRLLGGVSGAGLSRGSRAALIRDFPWGNEPPSPERCVWRGHRRHGMDTVELVASRRIPPGMIVTLGGDGMVRGMATGLETPIGVVVESEMDGARTVVATRSSGSTAPVLECLRCGGNKRTPRAVMDVRAPQEWDPCNCVGWMSPPRPKGASWCGAHDMAGNVWEWTNEGLHAGGSFRSEESNLARVVPEGQWLRGSGAADDVGFRVALSARVVT